MIILIFDKELVLGLQTDRKLSIFNNLFFCYLLLIGSIIIEWSRGEECGIVCLQHWIGSEGEHIQLISAQNLTSLVKISGKESNVFGFLPGWKGNIHTNCEYMILFVKKPCNSKSSTNIRN